MDTSAETTGGYAVSVLVFKGNAHEVNLAHD